jgi:hypothetical protein
MMVWVAIAFLALSAQLPSGVAGAVEVEAVLALDSARIGEPVVLTVSLGPVPPTAEVLFPELPDSGQLVALGPPRIVTAEGETRSASYQLVAWEAGELQVPAGNVRVRIDGTELTIPIPDLALRVVSILPGEAEVGDIAWRPPADVVGGNWSLAETIAAASLVLALLTGAALYLRRRGRAAAVPLPEPIAPRERALAGLDVLARCGLIEAGELKGFYSELSLIMRQFLADTDERWGLDLTTLQLMVLVARDGIADPDVRTLEALLSEADLVKFARLRPKAREAEAALNVAREWVDGFERIAPQAEVLEGEDIGPSEGGAEDVLADLEAVFVADDGVAEPVGDEEDKRE